MKNPVNILLAVVAVGLLGWIIYQNAGSSSAPVTLPEGFDAAGATVFEVDGTDTKMIENRDANGMLKESGALLNGLKTGTWTTYHSDQRVKTISTYVGGKLNGLYMEMTERGMIELQAFYKNGLLEGPYNKYKSGSRKLEERNYLAGELHGVYRKYDDRKNKLQQEIHYKNGIQDGLFRYFDEEGNITMEYTYKDGKKVSGGIVEK